MKQDPAVNAIVQFHQKINNAYADYKLHDMAAAAEIYREVAKNVPDHRESELRIGHFAFDLGDTDEALKWYKLLDEKYPDDKEAKLGIANVYRKLRNIIDAEKYFQEAIKLDENYYQAYSSWGLMYYEIKRFRAAEEKLIKALEINPADIVSMSNLAGTYYMLHQQDKAMELCEKVLRMSPNSLQVSVLMGHLNNAKGDMEKALYWFDKVTRIDPNWSYAYEFIARSKKITIEDSRFIRRAEEALKRPMAPAWRSSLEMSLAKMYDDIKEYDKAFQHLRMANLLASRIFDEKYADRLASLQRKVFVSRFIQQNQNRGSDSDLPVFVLGMPRSGTTLMEQIIAAHPCAAGAGELTTLGEIMAKMTGGPSEKNSLKKMRSMMSDEFVESSIDQYLDILQKEAIGADAPTRIVDKMPDNYLMIGFIATFFPKARIIQATRNPMDIGLSCYFQNFTNIHWAFDLQQIGRRYRYYREMMAFWKSQLPEGKITEIVYEDLVNDPAAEAPKLLAAAGLDWRDDILDNYRSQGNVFTASSWQVRQSIYKTSRKKWASYAKFLAPLGDEIVEYLDEDDKAIFAEAGVKLRSPSLLRRWRKVS